MQKKIRFGANNFLREIPAADVTVLSELTNFDYENFLDVQRTKVYRTNGNFTIDSTNNKLYLTDDVGDFTVTLTNANYNGGAALATHIQTQINASSSGWSCTYNSSTGKFTISRSAGTDTLRFTQTTNAAWDTLGYTGVSDTSAAVQGAADRRRNHTNERIVFDLSTPMTVTQFNCIGPLSSVFTISTNATCVLMGNTMDAWTSPALTHNLTVDSGGIHAWLDDESNTTYRYWAFDITDRENPVGPTGIQIGYIYLGDYDTVTGTNVAPGFTKTYTDPSEILRSENGLAYTRRRQKYRTWEGLNIGFISNNDRVALEDLYELVGNATPIFVSLDPGNEVSLTPSEVTMYCRFKEEPTFVSAIRDLYAMSLSLDEAV